VTSPECIRSDLEDLADDKRASPRKTGFFFPFFHCESPRSSATNRLTVAGLEIQLSFRITIYNSAKKPRRILVYAREYARASSRLPGPRVGGRRAQTELFGPVRISPAGRSALIRHRSLAHRHVHASTSACNHPPRSPSFPRMTFRLSCRAGPQTARGTAPGARNLMAAALGLSAFASSCRLLTVIFDSQ
jgi:hypothetical protein